MERKHNTANVPLAKSLRKNMTKQERKLWYDFLKFYPEKFLRQKIFGNYIVDFYCAKAKLVIELDGSQHYEENEIQKDAERTEYLMQYGLKVLRISNMEVDINFKGICEYIDAEVKQSLSR